MSKAYKVSSPCRTCEKRKVGCHSNCEEYQQWKESGIEMSPNYFVPSVDFSKKNRSQKEIRRKEK